MNKKALRAYAWEDKGVHNVILERAVFSPGGHRQVEYETI